MAKVKAPLLSNTASGKIGKTLVFLNCAGGEVVKKLGRPPQSLPARNNPIRPVYTAGRLAYNALDDAQKNLYKIAAKEEVGLTSYTYFMRQYIKEHYIMGIKKVVLNLEVEGAQSARLSECVGKVRFYEPGTSTILYEQIFHAQSETPMNIFEATVYDIPPGIYDVRVFATATLARKTPNVTIPPGLDFITLDFLNANGKRLKAGDVRGDGSINVFDLQMLAGNFSQTDE